MQNYRHDIKNAYRFLQKKYVLGEMCSKDTLLAGRNMFVEYIPDLACI